MTLRQIKCSKTRHSAYMACIRRLMAHGRTKRELAAAMKAPVPF